MQLHIRQKQDPVTLYLEGQKESYITRAAQETPFYEAYYMQCIESTVADGYEMFLLDFSRESQCGTAGSGKRKAVFQAGWHPPYHPCGAPQKKTIGLGRNVRGNGKGV